MLGSGTGDRRCGLGSGTGVIVGLDQELVGLDKELVVVVGLDQELVAAVGLDHELVAAVGISLELVGFDGLTPHAAMKKMVRTRPDSYWFESFNGYFHCCSHYISFTKQFCNLVGSDGACQVFAKPSFYSLDIKCLQRLENCPIEWLCFVGGMRR